MPNKLCCELNMIVYCGECNFRQCRTCWENGAFDHFRFGYVGKIQVKCIITDKVLIEGETFGYYG